MTSTDNHWIKVGCVIAIIASLAGAAADILLLYHPAGGYEKSNYDFLVHISDTRLLAGSYLGILAIPLEILGLFHIYRALEPAGKIYAGAIVFLSVYIIFPGVAYHATVAFTATLVKLQPALTEELFAEKFSFIKTLFEPLGAILFIGFAAVSLMFSYLVAFRQTHFKIWMALCNPLAFYMVFVALYLFVPVVGNFLIPAGFNLAFFFFFACSLLAVKN